MSDKKEELKTNISERSKKKGSFAKRLNVSKYIAFILGGIAIVIIAFYLFGFGDVFSGRKEENFFFTVQLTIHIIAILFALAVLQLKSIWKVNEFVKKRIKEANDKGTRKPDCHDKCQKIEIIDGCYQDIKKAMNDILPKLKIQDIKKDSCQFEF